MEKLLTISVAAYNVEQFLENTLGSLSDSRYVDQLEVFVVDDGGKDGSLKIALEFEKRFPGTFHAIHKENGGYGSTVNYSISHASGKYFKLLDGDDWMDCDSLALILQELKSCEDDVVITDYFIGPDPQNLSRVSNRNPNNSVVKVKDYRTDFPHGMWAIFYKTDVLKRSEVVLPEHSLYTDQVYSTVPFAYAETIRFYDIPVYCYRYGREEQSTSRVSRLKHAKEMLNVCEYLYSFYNCHSQEGNQYLFCRVSRYYIVALRTLLLFPINKKNQTRVKKYENRIKKKYPEIYQAACNPSGMGRLIRFLRFTGYKAYWGIALLPESVLNR